MRATNPKSFAILLLALPFCLLQTGCSSFSRNWSSALKQPIQENSLAGPWEGQWISDVNGHHGRLRCLVSSKGEGKYDAVFQAKYKHFLTFSYTVPMEARRRASSWLFHGEADLGKLAGGVYTYEGAATATNFFSTYDNRYDHGKFEMARPR
jgi:hypothetical protein